MIIYPNLLIIFGLIGALTSIIYLLYKIKNRKQFQENEGQKEHLKVSQILQNDISNQENKTSRESLTQFFVETKAKLLQVMEEKKPYRDPDITLHKLAALLKTDSILLEQIITKDLNQNFVNFINEYRVEEMKQFLQDENLNLTFKTLVQNSGFKSKSAVNLAFKKSTGMTLSNYMKSNQTVEA